MKTDVKTFSQLIDAIVVNLTNANQEAEPGNGSLYITLQRNFNKSFCLSTSIGVGDNHRSENVGTLIEFVDIESEFLTIASETIGGVLKESPKEGETYSCSWIIFRNQRSNR